MLFKQNANRDASKAGIRRTDEGGRHHFGQGARLDETRDAGNLVKGSKSETTAGSSEAG